MSSGQKHPLEALDGRRLGRCRLRLGRLAPLKLSGWRAFSLLLEDENGRRCNPPLVEGIYSCGGKGIPPWMDICYSSRVAFEGSEEKLELEKAGLDRELFLCLSELIPADGHIMVEYESDCHKPTLDALGAGVPPAATPLGWLLFQSGFYCGFRDWYIAEGGNEGPRKLQVGKPINAEHEREARQKLRVALEEFLSRQPDPKRAELEEAARERARLILAALKQEPG